MTVTEIPQPPDIGKKKPWTFFTFMRWLLFGTPIASQRAGECLLSKLIALPVLCSDAISSVAYGGQQIALALCAAGLWLPIYRSTYSHYTMQISWAIAILLIIVAASYWQTLFAYPNGGGSYVVSRDNLGLTPSLIAAAALLIDYVLTVSVSVASGLQNLKDIPLFASFNIGHHMVGYSLAAIVIILFANLRGLRESGTLFAVPHYLFIFMCYVMIVLGLLGPLIGWHFHPQFVNQVVPNGFGASAKLFQTAGLFIVLRAFANGCSAMTGVEAVSNGIPAFREPKSRNAALTLVIMATILGTIFLGVSWLTVKFHVVYWEFDGMTAPAVIDQLSGMVFGKEGASSFAYVTTQIATALILIIAAETGFAGFPRLASILASDGFLPRQLTNVGDRLAFNNGIILLGVFSSLFIILEKGSVDRLIPFFAIGVFLAFTLSQTGMVRHWISQRGQGWLRKAIINGIGACASFIVVVDIVFEKFLEGAWLVVLMVIGLLLLFKRIHRHYIDIAQELDPSNYKPPTHPMKNNVLVLVQGVHAGTLSALEYADSISANCSAIYVANDPDRTAQTKADWEKYVADIPLIIIDSPFRSLIVPIMRYLDFVHREQPNERITVIVGEFVPTRWWEHVLHGNTGLILKLALLGRRDIVVSNVRYWIDERKRPRTAVDPLMITGKQDTVPKTPDCTTERDK